ncbi:MAG TPA: GNAT family N-acetyltransferase [Steroidobacteraceae bacterium]|nr:GNAT family N-acetyltransferase [Steroidobacteraceae bacterium]
MRSLALYRESIESHVASDLMAAFHAELAHRSPDTASYSRVTADQVAPGRGAFVIARSTRVPIGCGAIRRVDAATAELKVMYVMPSYRRRGVGRELLKYLEAVARELGVESLFVETDVRQLEALSLYRSAGYTEPPAEAPRSAVRMERRLPSIER